MINAANGGANTLQMNIVWVEILHVYTVYNSTTSSLVLPYLMFCRESFNLDKPLVILPYPIS